MTNWLRSDTAKLAEIAGQVGLTPDEAVQAITMGAKLIGVGLSETEFQDMLNDYFEMHRKSWERWGRR